MWQANKTTKKINFLGDLDTFKAKQSWTQEFTFIWKKKTEVSLWLEYDPDQKEYLLSCNVIDTCRVFRTAETLVKAAKGWAKRFNLKEKESLVEITSNFDEDFDNSWVQEFDSFWNFGQP